MNREIREEPKLHEMRNSDAVLAAYAETGAT
jgi:hypothetical protein